MNWTLLVLALLVLAFTIIGLYKGVLGIIFGFVSVIIVTLVATFVSPSFSGLLKKNTKLYDTVYERTEEYYEEHGWTKDSNHFIRDYDIPLPEVLKNTFFDELNEIVDEGAQAYNKVVVESTASLIFRMICYVILMLLTGLVLLILFIILKALSKLPVVEQVNRVAGGIVGCIFGIVIVWVAMTVVSMLGNQESFAIVVNDIDRNPVLSFMYNNNPLLLIMSKFL